MRIPTRFGLLVVLGLVFVLSLPCAAQEPDASILSGTWVMNVAKSKIDKRFPITSQTVVISYSAPILQMKYTTDGKDLMIAWTVDDKYHTVPNTAFPNSETILKASWKKSALATDNRSRMGSPGNQVTSIVLEEHWTLSADGKVLTKKTSADFDSDHVYIFEKQ
jgi:hypothetical protein